MTRRSRLAGIFFPRPETTLPIELKRGLYDTLSADMARQLKRRRVSEGDVLKDFEASRETRRAARAVIAEPQRAPGEAVVGSWQSADRETGRQPSIILAISRRLN